MKDNKKLIVLLLGLVCLVICGVLLLTMCSDPGSQDETTEPTGTTVETTTEPEEETTQAEEETTEPESTEETTEEPTEAPTENPDPPVSNMGNGTGGSYTPQVTEPAEETTEPEEEATEPEIDIPAAGSQENPYYESVLAPGSFTTVKIPAKGSIYYTVKTSGAFLQIQSAEAAVLYDGKLYEPAEGIVLLPLPAGKEPVRSALQFVNNGTGEQAFAVSVVEAEGAQSNPIVLTELAALQIKLEQDDADGLYYTWTADKSGILTMGLSSVTPAAAGADIVVTVNGNTVRLSESEKGILQIPVTAQDQVTVQVVAAADAAGSYPAVEIQVNGYIAPMKPLTVDTIPQTVSTDEIPAGENAYYSISGVKDAILTVQDKDVTVYYNGTAYGADEDGNVTVKLTQDTVQLEFVNGSSVAKVYELSFRYPVGHKLNPEVLGQLGELRTIVEAGTDGYYYSYTVPSNGSVTFQVKARPEQPNVWTNIVLTNTQTQVTESLMTSSEVKEAVTVETAAGDEIIICVSVTAGDAVCVDARLTVLGQCVSYRSVEYPGFEAQVSANSTGYFEGYNLDGTIFSLEGEKVAVVHNGLRYEPQAGKIEFMVTAENRMPAQFEIENRGEEDAVYTVSLRYPVGNRMNPAALALGGSYIVQQEGAEPYYFNYTAPKAGELVVSFDAEAQWCYALDNLTQQVYGDEQYSDSEDSTNMSKISVQAGDEIQLWVNTYNGEEPWNAPAGRVDFTATLITGPVAITDLSKPFETVLLAGETVQYTGALQGVQLTIENAQYATLCYNGAYYEADENGVLTVSFLEPNGSENEFSFTLQNRNVADWSCTMDISGIPGGPLAPAQLLLGVSGVTNGEGAPGYWFSYTAPKAGQLILTFDAEKNWCYAVNGGENQYSTDPAASERTVAVQTGDEILIWVNTYDPENPQIAPADSVSFEATLLSGPVQIDDLTQPFAATLLAGETVRYTGVLHGTTVTIADAQDATLCYNGAYYEAGEDGVLAVTFLEPNGLGELEFTLHNRAMSDWNCTMEIAAVNGGPQAPGELVLGNSSVESGEGASGYWFCYTAPKAGELILTFDAEKTWCYAVNGGDIHYSDSEPAVTENAVAVEPGDKVLIWVNTYDPAAPEVAPAGTVSFDARLVTSPVELDLTEKYEAQLLAQETAQFTGELRNAIITFTNAEDLTVTYNGDVYAADDWGIIKVTFLEPDSEGQWKFTLRNNGFSDVDCRMQFSGTVGSWLNPADMVLGTNTVQQAADAADYCFTYTAPKTGQLVLTFAAEANWRYSVGDGETQYSGSEPAANEAKIAVAEGDQVTVRVNTYDPAAPETVPAGTVAFDATLITGPVLIEDPTTAYEASLIAGETAYFSGPFEGAVITVAGAENAVAVCDETVYTPNAEGIIEFAFLQPNADGQWEFSLYNGAETDAVYTMTFRGEEGSWLTPADLILGTTTVTREAGDDAYYFNYMVTKTGKLQLTFDAEAQWCYSIGGGETQYSGTADNVVQLDVENGDLVELQVNTYDPAAPETAPAGTVEFHATLLTGPVTVNDSTQPTMIELLAGETVTVSGSLYGEKLTIKNAPNLTLTFNGTAYTADTNGGVIFTFPEAITDESESLEFTLYNGAAEDKSYTLIFGEEKGTASNPAELVVGTNTAVCQAGSDGYYFTFTATRDCQIRLTFDKNSQWAFEWQYGSGNSDKASTVWRFRSGKILAGQTVTVLVKTYDSENSDVVPEGTVQFEMDIPTYY